MSLDGFIGDSPRNDLIFSWFFAGSKQYTLHPELSPENDSVAVVDELFRTTGAVLTGRRTYDLAKGWRGRHPIGGVPVVVLTHRAPDVYPVGESGPTFVTTGLKSAVAYAKSVAGKKNVSVAGASVAQQCLREGLADEIYVHVAPVLVGSGTRLFEDLPQATLLRRTETTLSPSTTHLKFVVVRKAHRSANRAGRGE